MVELPYSLWNAPFAACSIRQTLWHCDCGYDFAKRSGGERTPFRKRIPKVFVLAGLLGGFVLVWMVARALSQHPR
jgi:hypothetical protein